MSFDHLFVKNHNVSLRYPPKQRFSKSQEFFQPQGADIESIGQGCDEDKAHMSWENTKKIGAVHREGATHCSLADFWGSFGFLL